MKKPSYILILLVFVCASFVLLFNTKKTTTIIFESDVETKIEIYDPIDGTKNSFFVTKEVILKPNITFVHEVIVDNFAFLRFGKEGENSRPFILILEGNKIKIDFKNGEQVIEGCNAKGNQYFYVTTQHPSNSSKLFIHNTFPSKYLDYFLCISLIISIFTV